MVQNFVKLIITSNFALKRGMNFEDFRQMSLRITGGNCWNNSPCNNTPPALKIRNGNHLDLIYRYKDDLSLEEENHVLTLWFHAFQEP